QRLEMSDLLRSRRSMLEAGELLDVPGMAAWQENFDKLREFWVIAPNPLDDSRTEISMAVAKCITHKDYPTRYVHFLYAEDAKGRLQGIREIVTKRLEEIGRPTKDVNHRIVAYNI